MLITLKNKQLKLIVSTYGAEICSLKDIETGKDIIWNGNPAIWKYHAPILFPHCGKIKDGYVLIDGNRYPLKSNGFVRNLEHKVIKQAENSVVFELNENEYTLERFPYKFCMNVSYELVDNHINFLTTVKNTDKKSFSFSLGSHSAFKIDNKTPYQIEFEKREPLTKVVCLENGFLASDNNKGCPYTEPYGETDNGIIPISSEGFGNGHLFTEIKSDWVGLRNLTTNELVQVNTKSFPYVMIWQNKGEPEFVCIEPWYGMPDADNTDHNWNNKPGLIELLPGKEFTSNQSICFLK